MIPKRSPHSRQARNRTLTSDTRGQNYALGLFLLLAAVSFSTLGVLVVGVDTLAGATDQQAINAGKQNMQHLNQEIIDVSKGAPYREIALDMADSTAEFGDSYTVRLRVTGGGINIDKTYSSRTIRYRVPSEETTIRYTSGLVSWVGAGGGQSQPIASPLFQTSTKRTVIYLPVVEKASNSPSSLSVGEPDTVYALAEPTANDLIERQATTGAGAVTQMNGRITIEGIENVGAWVEYFEESGFTSINTFDRDGDGQADTVRAVFHSEKLFFKATRVGVTLSGQE